MSDNERMALRLIVESVEQRGYPPSRAEIADACGWRARSHAQTLVKMLEAKGLIRVDPSIPRGIQITETGMIALTETV